MTIDVRHQQMPLCATCRQTLSAGYEMEEIQGYATTKMRCAMCGANTYGGVYNVTLKKNRRKAND